LRPAAKKGSAEVLILAALEDGQLHGYDIAREIAREVGRAADVPRRVALSPPLQARGSQLDPRAWVEKAGNAAAAITVSPLRAEALGAQRGRWAAFVAALTKAAGLEHA
jgi:hypothetical protein